MTIVTSRSAPVPGLQRGMWFLDRMRPGSPAYLAPWVFTFDRAVDPALLRRALDVLIARHEALRTAFTLGPDGPRRDIGEPLPVPMATTDLSELPAVEQPAALAGLLDRWSRRGFDLERAPLLRAEFVRGTAVPDTLCLVLHHIIWDGRSAEVFERELSTVYTRLAAGAPPELPPPAAADAEHAGDDEELDYWRTRLAGVPAELRLPADRPRPAAPTCAGGTEEFGLPAGTAAAVKALAVDACATPFVVQLAAFAVLLHRLTGARDLVIGTPVSTRTSPELAELIGYFVNMVALRVAVDPGMSFRELVEHVRDTAFDAYAASEVPFDSVVDALGVPRSTRHAPLVQVVFGAHTEDPTPLPFGAAAATRRTHHNATSKFDLTWSTFDSGELRGEVEYSSDLFDPGTVRRMIGHWRTVLAHALAHPDTPVWRLPLLDDAERALALAPPTGPVTEPVCLHRAFEAAADRHPDRPAVTCDGRTLSYRELDAAANRLAHTLIADGVRRGDRVGVLLDRGIDVVVAILAVLKAGAAYVPVDLTSPVERATFVFGDTGVRLVVTDQGAVGQWRSLDLAGQAGRIAAASATRPEVDVSPADLAYLIFTSGSTGKPKGVAVAHEQVARLMASGREHFGFAPTDVWTLFHSYAFDWTVWELWAPLHHGGRLVVVPYVVSRAPEVFAELLAAQQVSCLCLTPSALRALTETLYTAPRALPHLRWVMLGGEALDPAVVRRWFDLDPCPPALLCNLYGITETTVHVTTHDLPGPAGFDRSLVGRPLPHLAALVLDERLRPCPVGVTGELHVGGHALADGYWGRPGLTARRFVPDPYGEVRGGRLYRTGDLARRLPGGGLEYVGRHDDQVKVRGFRIELGEMEAALTAEPGITSCVVTVRDERLAAYVTVSGPPPGYPRLRAALERTLPAHLIPATVTVLDVLPVTVNGKVDRAALPAPDTPAPSASGTVRVAPATDRERAVAAAWSTVLGVADVGAHDNFFHLGGDSIRAVHLAARLRDAGWELSLPDLFTAPTPAELGPLLHPAAEQATGAPFDLVSPRDRAALPADVVDAYPMVSMQLAMIYHMELSDDAGGYHNVNSYRVAGTLDVTALRAAIGDVMRRHPVLRTSLDVSRYHEPLQLVHAEAAVPLRTEDLTGLSDMDQRRAVTAVFDEHCAARFDLRMAPLFRITAQRLGRDAFQLTVAEHHAILDGWSFTSMLTEILERHAGPARPPQPPPASTFRDFVAAERAAVEAEERTGYWRNRVAGASGVLFATGPADPFAPAEIPRTVEHVLPGADTTLRDVARAAGVAVKTVGLAAHVLALAHVTGRNRFTTGLSVNGRLDRAGGTEVYGLFLNTVPLVLDLDTLGHTGTQLLTALHAREADLVAHRRVPFAHIARHLTDTRLETCFAFLRFHALGRLAGSATRIVDDRIGCEPTMRYEPTNFALGVALVQDPTSARVLLAVDHLRSVVPDVVADAYATAFADALRTLAEHPGATLPTPIRP